ncbi:hypothetical protein F2Q69_00008133 [Brassica cretica]|uniref:Uncharacterized protein n=1 Tax=Brassica cretica TaxID=69181 RepID=A0A8S9PBP1_BRACR|nr:hypothetical protein F2Q69_00008133 [Brassica cretica]
MSNSSLSMILSSLDLNPHGFVLGFLLPKDLVLNHGTLALIPICCDGQGALLDQMLYLSQTGCSCWRPDAQLEPDVRHQMSNPSLSMILSDLGLSPQGFVLGLLLPKGLILSGIGLATSEVGLRLPFYLF